MLFRPAKVNLEKIVLSLEQEAKDPYSASLPLLARAELGEDAKYHAALGHMLKTLSVLNKTPQTYSEWMRSESFKAWMWGRVGSAAVSKGDINTQARAQKELAQLLQERKDNLAFSTWAWAYRAALSPVEYERSKKHMMEGTALLAAEYQKQKTVSAASDVLWALTMDLYAAAKYGAKEDYDFIKAQIKTVTGKTTVGEALLLNLPRTEQSNEYAAWALAKARLSAAVKPDPDEELYRELDPFVSSAIDQAKAFGKKGQAEYVLATLDNQLAQKCYREKHLHMKHKM